jgi:hypothetical protein
VLVVLLEDPEEPFESEEPLLDEPLLEAPLLDELEDPLSPEPPEVEDVDVEDELSPPEPPEALFEDEPRLSVL